MLIFSISVFVLFLRERERERERERDLNFVMFSLISVESDKHGIMNCFLPSPETLASLEAKDCMQPLIHFPGFVTYSRPFLPHTHVTTMNKA